MGAEQSCHVKTIYVHAGHSADTFNMGSLRNDLQLPAHFASTGSIEEEDDEDEDIMLMGTTPQVRAMP